MIRLAVAAAILSVAVTAVLAQSDPIKTRKDLMSANDKNYKAIRAVVRGQAPYDQAKVNAAFAQWGETAQKFGSLFPDNSKTGGDTSASPKIWQNRADFDAKLAAFGKAVNDNRDKVKSVNDLKTALAAVDKTCGDCHEVYRVRRR
jgi:cytochrome c556